MGSNSALSSKGKTSNKGDPVYPLENAAIETKNPRRIVKAAKNGPVVEEIYTAIAVNEDDDDEIRGVEMLWESPSVARENVQEKAASQNQARKLTAQELRSSKRDKNLMERRLTSPQAKTKNNVQPSANPMSRFLSAFSLNSHPEHKRRAESTIATEMKDPNKPVEKRLRPSVGDEQDAYNGKYNADTNDKGDVGPFSSPDKDDNAPWNPTTMVVVTSAVAIVAIVVGLLLRAKKVL